MNTAKQNLSNKRTILITGASGLIGKQLTEMLLRKGYEINVLGRSKTKTVSKSVKSFTWNIETGEAEAAAFAGVNAIVHLAGAGIAEKRWSDERKQEIIDSRVKSAKLIYDFLKKSNHNVTTFISASAVGYYGHCGNELISEEHKAGSDFLAEVCKQWEQSAIQFSKIGLREVRCRIGMVLAKKGGVLPELTKTLPLGIAGYFAEPDLYYSWIHMDDVCGIIIHALENENIKGAYNTCAPEPLPMKKLMQEIVKAKKNHALLLPVPAIGIKLALGEMSKMLLSSQRCSAKKILESGYNFKYEKIEKALKAIYS